VIRRIPAQSDSGISLVELLVTMFILSILGTVVVTFFASFTQTFTRERAASDSANIAAVGMNELTRVIRSGTEIEVQGQVLNNPVFLLAGNEDVTLYSFLDTDAASPTPVKVRFYVDTNRVLKETRWSSTIVNGKYFSFNTSPDSTRSVARLITTGPVNGLSLFTYYAADGTVIAPPATGSFSTDQLRAIASVRVTLSVQADPTRRADPVVLQNAVGIPNLGVSRVEQG
jgi:type II secretory pathway pseudopilin PulG